MLTKKPSWRWLLFALLLFSATVYSKDKDASTTHSSLYFGGEYGRLLGYFGHSNSLEDLNSYLGYAGAYLGLETNFGSPYISLINEISYDYSFMSNKKDVLSFIPYNIGMRLYLGIPYVFVDFTLGLFGLLYVGEKDSLFLPTPAVNMALGFNIPLSKGINLQLMGTVGYGMGMRVRAGLEIQL